MAGDPDGVPAGPLEEIAYLARSANRVDLLNALTAGSHSRGELADITGIATTTIGRIINEFEERGWVERTADGTYTATDVGALVARQFAPLVDAMETINRLGVASTWIPTAELSIGIEAFTEARLRRSPPNAPLDTVEYLGQCFREATSARVLTFLAAPGPVDQALTSGVGEDRLTAEIVLAGGLIEYIYEQDDRPDWIQWVDDGISLYRHDGHVPCHLFLFDSKVLVLNDRPSAGGIIECNSDRVLEGMTDFFERYRDDAARVHAERFA